MPTLLCTQSCAPAWPGSTPWAKGRCAHTPFVDTRHAAAKQGDFGRHTAVEQGNVTKNTAAEQGNFTKHTAAKQGNFTKHPAARQEARVCTQDHTTGKSLGMSM